MATGKADFYLVRAATLKGPRAQDDVLSKLNILCVFSSHGICRLLSFAVRGGERKHKLGTWVQCWAISEPWKENGIQGSPTLGALLTLWRSHTGELHSTHAGRHRKNPSQNLKLVWSNWFWRPASDCQRVKRSSEAESAPHPPELACRMQSVCHWSRHHWTHWDEDQEKKKKWKLTWSQCGYWFFPMHTLVLIIRLKNYMHILQDIDSHRIIRIS